MPRAVFHNKVGETESLDVRAGQTVRDVLRAQGIPANNIITYLNGKIVSEALAVIGPDDYVEFCQIRHYDLGVTRNPHKRVFSAIGPIYTKSVMFDDRGEVECWQEQYDEEGFLRYVEQTFIESIRLADMIKPQARMVVGLSGGRDSVAFLKLLDRTGDQLPEYSMVAVTITGLPDWEETETFRAAKASCEMLGIQQVIVGPDQIKDAFQLTKPYVEVMNEVLAGDKRALSMVISHQVLRRMLELEAEKRDIATIVLGLNADDLISSLINWFTTGFRMGPIPLRRIGKFEYSFPLYHITKKELTLYLELASPNLNRQGAPGRFTTGPGERALVYAITDHLYELWPGIDHYAFKAFSNIQKYLTPANEQECRICGSTYICQEEMSNPVDICDVCDFFIKQGYASEW